MASLSSAAAPHAIRPHAASPAPCRPSPSVPSEPAWGRDTPNKKQGSNARSDSAGDPLPGFPPSFGGSLAMLSEPPPGSREALVSTNSAIAALASAVALFGTPLTRPFPAFGGLRTRPQHCAVLELYTVGQASTPATGTRVGEGAPAASITSERRTTLASIPRTLHRTSAPRRTETQYRRDCRARGTRTDGTSTRPSGSATRGRREMGHRFANRPRRARRRPVRLHSWAGSERSSSADSPQNAQIEQTRRRLGSSGSESPGRCRAVLRQTGRRPRGRRRAQVQRNESRDRSTQRMGHSRCATSR